MSTQGIGITTTYKTRVALEKPCKKRWESLLASQRTANDRTVSLEAFEIRCAVHRARRLSTSHPYCPFSIAALRAPMPAASPRPESFSAIHTYGPSCRSRVALAFAYDGDFGTAGKGSPASRFFTSLARKSAKGAMSSPTLAFSRAFT